MTDEQQTDESKTARIARGARRTQVHTYVEKHYYYAPKANGVLSMRWRWIYPSEPIKWHR